MPMGYWYQKGGTNECYTSHEVYTYPSSEGYPDLSLHSLGIDIDLPCDTLRNLCLKYSLFFLASFSQNLPLVKNQILSNGVLIELWRKIKKQGFLTCHKEDQNQFLVIWYTTSAVREMPGFPSLIIWKVFPQLPNITVEIPLFSDLYNQDQFWIKITC